MIINPIRHLEVFSPHKFGEKRVDVIGCGATGSRIVLSLAKLGLENIHVWDFDKVEEHNIPNQVFGLKDVGSPKVRALAKLVKTSTGAKIATYNKRMDGTQKLGEIVFLLTDTMSSRKQIWNGALKFKLQTKFVIETRMGADSGRVYSINPNKPSHIREWEKTLCNDGEAETSACGASISVGPTAEIISGLAVWQMMRWFNIENGAEDELDNEIMFGLRPMTLFSRKF